MRFVPKRSGRLLRDLKYSLKANVKRRAGSQHPDCYMQFEYIEAQKRLFLSQGWPIVSLDGKKKELIGNFKNAGQSWCLEAEAVNDHDFESEMQRTCRSLWNLRCQPQSWLCVCRTIG